MKFRDPETGEVYDGMEFTPCSVECKSCIYGSFFKDAYECEDFCVKYPKVAAHLMGYEIIE